MSHIVLQLRHDSAANWEANNPILATGEVGINISTNPHCFKIGNGNHWNDILYPTAVPMPAGTGFFHLVDGVQEGVARAIDLTSSDVTGVLAATWFPGLTGDVTAVSGSLQTVLALAQSAVHTWYATQTFSVPPVFTDAVGTRTALGLGSLATQSGSFSGLSSGNNTGDNAANSLYAGLVTNATHTGDVTGSTVLTLANAQPGPHAWASTQTFAVAPVFQDQAMSRAALGLGTAALDDSANFTPKIPQVQAAGNSNPVIAPLSSDSLITLTALSVAVTAIQAPAAPVWEGKKLLFRITDNGVARALSGWSASYRGFVSPLPTTTTAGKTLYLGFMYNSLAGKWDLIAISLES